VFEPSAGWILGYPAPLPFDQDDQVVYSPHLYQGGISGGTLEAGFARAAQEASELFQGAPVVSGEWGSGPERAADPEDDYFERHLAEQDAYRFGATIWTWREACGDPHKYAPARNGQVPQVWGFFEVDCETNSILGPRTALVDVMRKMSVRFAAGPMSELVWTPDDSALEASGGDARAGNRMEVFVPTDDPSSVEVTLDGLAELGSEPWPGGTLFHASAEGGPWSIRLSR